MQYIRAELHNQVYKVRRRTTVNTKLDAPFTLLSIRGQASRIPVSSEVKGKELQTPNVHLENLMPQEPSTKTGTTKSATALFQRVPTINDQRSPEKDGTDTRDVERSSAQLKSSKHEKKRNTVRDVNGFEAMKYLVENKAKDEMEKHNRVQADGQEAQRFLGQGYVQAEQELAETHRRTEEEGGKLTRKEQVAKEPEASRIQLLTDMEKIKRVAEEAKAYTRRHPKISENVAKKIVKRREAKQAAKKAKRAAKKAEQAAKEAKQAAKKAGDRSKRGEHKLQGPAEKMAEEAKWERSSERHAFMLDRNIRNRAKTDDGSTFAVRFTSQEQEALREVTLQPEAQEAPPITIKRHLSVSTGNYSQRHGATPEQKPDLKIELKSEIKPFPDDVNHGNPQFQTVSQYSVPITREESEGKRPGAAYIGKERNVFYLRKHATMNPFERLQAIQHVGEITSRDQAMGLHGHYHLQLFAKQPEDVRKS